MRADVPFETVAQGNGASSHLRQGDYVIRSQARWQKAWQALNWGVMPTPPTPVVDFQRSMLLVVQEAQRGGGGYSIAVTHVAKLARQLVVDVEERSPGAGCMTSALVTAPYHVVRVPRTGGAVMFTHRQTTYSCP